MAIFTRRSWLSSEFPAAFRDAARNFSKRSAYPENWPSETLCDLRIQPSGFGRGRACNALGLHYIACEAKRLHRAEEQTVCFKALTLRQGFLADEVIEIDRAGFTAKPSPDSFLFKHGSGSVLRPAPEVDDPFDKPVTPRRSW